MQFSIKILLRSMQYELSLMIKMTINIKNGFNKIRKF